MIYQGFALGEIVANRGRRHPAVGDRVLLGAHSALFGSISIGDGARIGSSVTLRQSVREEVIITMKSQRDPGHVI